MDDAVNKRIAQFENMCSADPSNEMAHFSLGKAYADAGRFKDAAQSYARCVQLVPDMSKAYQMAGDMFIRANDHDQAAAVLVRGYLVAAEKGDRMPQTAIAALLKQIGREAPPLPDHLKARQGSGGGGQGLVGIGLPGAGAGQAGAGAAGIDPENLPPNMILCRQSGRPGTRMTRPPFKGPVGEWIMNNISHETFYKGWIPQGTKVINELRLDLSREKDQETYDQHMREYLGVE